MLLFAFALYAGGAEAANRDEVQPLNGALEIKANVTKADDHGRMASSIRCCNNKPHQSVHGDLPAIDIPFACNAADAGTLIHGPPASQPPHPGLTVAQNPAPGKRSPGFLVRVIHDPLAA